MEMPLQSSPCSPEKRLLFAETGGLAHRPDAPTAAKILGDPRLLYAMVSDVTLFVDRGYARKSSPGKIFKILRKKPCNRSELTYNDGRCDKLFSSLTSWFVRQLDI